MSKKVQEMTAAGSGATIGPIQPLGAEKEKVDEMLKIYPDVTMRDVVTFASTASLFMREDFEYFMSDRSYSSAIHVLREGVARALIRQKLSEVVRKKDGKYVLFAPNTGKKHSPKPVATFTSKLAAKRAELAKFPPKEPEKLERLRKQIEKLMKDPEARAKENMKETVDRDLFERALISSTLRKDLTESLINEKAFDNTHSERYKSFVNSLSRKSLANDKDYQNKKGNLDQVSDQEMEKKLKQIQDDLGMEVVSVDSKNHTDRIRRRAFKIKSDVEVGPMYLEVDGNRIKVRFSPEAHAAVTKCAPQNAVKIKALAVMGEGPDEENPEITQAQGELKNHTNQVVDFLDEFLAKLSPLALASLKKLLVMKYRKQGVKK